MNCNTRLFSAYLGFIGLLIFIFSFSGKSVAQESEYHIGPRDVLNLTIYAGGVKQQQCDFTVSPSGTINVPLLGNVKAAGLTLSSLEKNIYDPLARDYFVNPQVTLTNKDGHSLR